MNTRRTLLATAATIVLAVPFGSVTRAADPADRRKIRTLLDPREPAAVALAYTNNSAKVDVARYPIFKRGQTCANCVLIETGTGRTRGCEILPGRLVAATGWCRAWKARGT